MMMAGPTQLIEMMDKTYFKGRLSTALESFDESKEIAENIDLDMYNYHVKRAKLIKEVFINIYNLHYKKYKLINKTK